MWWQYMVDEGTLVLEERAGVNVYCYKDRPRTLDEVLSRAANDHRDRSALITPNGTLSYSELKDAVEKVAASISAAGVTSGDRVAVLLPNDARICLIELAVASLGAITVCLNARFQASEIATLMQKSGPRIAVVDAELREQVPRAALPPGCHLLISDDPTVDPEGLASLFPATGEGVRGHSSHEDDPVVMMFTSGTTGTPKGALLTHRNIIHSAANYVRYFSSGSETRTLIVMPMHYATGLIAQLVQMMLVGGQSIVWPRFKAREVVEALIKHEVTYFIGVPTMYQLMMLEESFSDSNLRNWKVGAYGGAPMPGDTIKALEKRLPELQLFDAYGLTETSSPATIMTPDRLQEKWGSVGRPVPGAEIKITDDSGREVPKGEAGELLIRGPMVIPGYWDDPEGTRRAIVDGWLRTGDLAKADEEEFVYVLDRQKDMIIRGGYKIYSVQLEYVLLDHPEIREAAVVGIPDAMFFEEILAVVVPKAQSGISEDDVRAFVASRVADYEVPKYVTFSESLPRNATGKVLKRELRDGFVGTMER